MAPMVLDVSEYSLVGSFQLMQELRLSLGFLGGV